MSSGELKRLPVKLSMPTAGCRIRKQSCLRTRHTAFGGCWCGGRCKDQRKQQGGDVVVSWRPKVVGRSDAGSTRRSDDVILPE